MVPQPTAVAQQKAPRVIPRLPRQLPPKLRPLLVRCCRAFSHPSLTSHPFRFYCVGVVGRCWNYFSSCGCGSGHWVFGDCEFFFTPPLVTLTNQIYYRNPKNMAMRHSWTRRHPLHMRPTRDTPGTKRRIFASLPPSKPSQIACLLEVCKRRE